MTNTPHSSPLAPNSSLLTPHSRIYIAGHRGMVGSAIVRCLESQGYTNIVTQTHQELDLLDQQAVREFLAKEKIDFVVLAAAKVGGIYANNTYPAEFIYKNLMIETNVIHEAYKVGVQHLLFLGSSCIYPKFAPQPMKEEHLLTGELEETNRPYALAKIAGIELCWSYNRQYNTKYFAVMPTNLFGPGDNYDLNNSHVVPALIRKFYLAKLAMQGDLAGIQKDEKKNGPIPLEIKESIGLSSDSLLLSPHSSPIQVMIWGTGKPRREFLYSEDMADACVHLLKMSNKELEPLLGADRNNGLPPLINIGVGVDITIAELAAKVAEVVGFNGKITYDSSKPDGTPRKLLDVTRLHDLGWQAQTSLEDGLTKAYKDFVNNYE